MQSGRPRRRWLRYSMRTLLCVVTVLALWCGYLTESAMRQRRIVEMINKHGGQVHYSFSYPSRAPGRYQYKDAPHGPEWMIRWLGPHYFQTVAVVILPLNDGPGKHEPKGVTEVELRQLAQLHGLKSLTILGGFHETSLRPEVIRLWAGSLRQLEVLEFAVAEVDDATLKSLGELPQLKLLSIFKQPPQPTSTPITDVGFASIERLTKLEKLDFLGANLSQIDGRKFARLQRLKTLTLVSCIVPDDAWQAIAELPDLSELNLQNTPASQAGIEHLKSAAGLTRLHLSTTKVPDNSVDELRKSIDALIYVRP